MRFRIVLAAAGLLGAIAGTRDARAVGTRTFELDSLDKLSGGDLKGVSVGSDGVVRAGWTLGNVPLPEKSGTTATCALALADGSVLVGTGPSDGGKIVQFTGDHVEVLASTTESAVSALAIDRAGVVYAATTSGRIYKVSHGKAEVFVTLAGVDSVLSLVADRTGALFAGTGSEGKVIRVDPAGAQSVYFKSDDAFVVSLALGSDGALFAGTSGKGLLYRITGPGRATVLYDFPGEDVHALAVGPDRTLWAVANEVTPTPGESNESTAKHSFSGRAPPGPTTMAHPKSGKGSLWRFDAQGRPERLMHHDEFHYVSLALDATGAPFVGTGAEGRVYTVDEAHRVSLVADTDERQVTAIAVAGRERFVVGSDPAVFHRVLSVGGPDSTWTSKPLDAGLRARFGHMRWDAVGAVEVSTRTGDTQAPDSTWSSWSAPVTNGGATSNPTARFAQVRARLREPRSSLSGVVLSFATENLRAIVTEVTARQKGTREPHEGKDGNLPTTGGEPPKHDSVVHVAWKVDNPDGDELRYRVHFRREGEAHWIEATRPDESLTKPELDWDSAALPEGRYRVRVEATDEMANPPAEVTRFALESSPLVVDNTPPVFRSLTLQARRLRADVVDGVGPVARVEVSVDGAIEWRPLAPVDGIFDTAEETLDADISSLLPTGPGLHLVSVRAFDAAGNFVVREVEAR